MTYKKSDYSHHCNQCELSKTCLAAPVRKKYFISKLEKVCENRQSFKDFFFICDGILKSYNHDSTGREIDVYFFFKGDIIGFEAIQTMRFNFSIAAISETIICKIPYASIPTLLQQDDNFSHSLLSHASKRLNLLTSRNHRSSEQKLVNFLLYVTLLLYQPGSSFSLPLSQLDVANHLNLTPETLSRILRHWKNQKIIKNQRGIRLDQSDIENLKKLSTCLASN